MMMENNIYLSKFNRENFKTLRYREKGLYLDERQEQAVYSFTYDNYEMHLYMPSLNGVVQIKFIEDAKLTLLRLDEWIDLLVEKELLDLSEDGLQWIVISEEDTELHFVGKRVNRDYGAYFEKDDNGDWFFEGLG
jgi:hypothetical protein